MLQEILGFSRHQLENGLKVLILEDHTLPILSYQVHFAVGSRHERPGITGISHLFEHMMFRGSKRLGPEEFSRIIQANGGNLNAFTTLDHTTYFENLPAGKLELAVSLEAERLSNLLLTEENLETEREVVRSERKMRVVNSPFGLLIEKLYALAYERHPYRWPIIGWDQDIRRLTISDCKEYYRRGYAPNNAVVVVVGDVREEEVLKLISKYYGHLPSQPPPEDTPLEEPPQRGEKRAVFKKVAQLEAFFAGFHVPGIAHQDVYPLLALAHILSEGKSSRFWRRFVKGGEAVEVKAKVDPLPFWPKDPALLIVYGIASPGTDLEGLEERVWEEIERVKDQGVSDEETSKAKKGLRSSFISGLETAFFRGLLGGIYEIKAGGFERAHGILEGFDGITPEEIRRVARTYLREENRTVVVLRPVSPEENEVLGPVE